MLNKKQIAILQPFEKHLKTALLDYIHGVYSKDIQAVRPVYESLGYKLDNANCSHCVLDMFKTLGKLYFENKKDKNEGKE